MKSLLSLIVICSLSAMMVGCGTMGRRNGDCAACRGGHIGGGRVAGHGGHHNNNNNPRHFEGDGGPQTGAVAYPYYTTRGPRDFLSSNPPSIGY